MQLLVSIVHHQTQAHSQININADHLHRVGNLLRQEHAAQTREDRAGAEPNTRQRSSVRRCWWSELERVSKVLNQQRSSWSVQIMHHVGPHDILLRHSVCEELC